jgi:hypothetical protein
MENGTSERLIEVNISFFSFFRTHLKSILFLFFFFFFIQTSLLALTALSLIREEPRRQINEAKIIPRVVQLLHSDNIRIKTAACKCARSLSRSVRTLRTSLVDAGISDPLIKVWSCNPF